MEALAARHGAAVERSLAEIGVCVLSAPAAAVEGLRADPAVARLGDDFGMRVTGACCGGAPANLDLTPVGEWVAERYGALQLDHPSVTLAIVDTGIGEHETLGHAQRGVSLLPGGDCFRDPSGHGTAMASLAAGCGDLPGVAPGVELLAVQVADPRGKARVSDVAAGIVEAVDRRAQVVLLALGGPRPSPALTRAIDYAEARGVLLVAAAGNRNVHHELYPAADPRVLSVAALAHDGGLAWSTALAAGTDLLEHGEGAVVALAGGYGQISGTSAAAARVAGVAALVRARAPQLGPAELRGLLRGTRGPSPFQGTPLARAFPAGPLRPSELSRALASPATTPRLQAARAFPARVAPGDALTCVVELEGRGHPTPPQTVRIVQAGQELGRLVVPALGPDARWRGTLAVRPRDLTPVEAQLGEQRIASALLPAERSFRDAGLAEVALEVAADGACELRATVEGRGLGAPRRLEARLGERVLEPRPLAPLAPGERVELAWTLPAEEALALPDAIVTCELRLSGVDDEPENDVAWLELLPPRDGGIATQYQQGGKLSFIADAPWRLAPGRDYLPVMLFVPEKGDLDPNTWLELERVALFRHDVPVRTTNPQLLYRDSRSAGQTAEPGVVLLDEMGQAVRRAGRPDLRAFRHDRIQSPGRYTIVRVPRAAFGVSGGADEDRYVTCEVEWTNRRRFLSVFWRTHTGSYRKTLKTRFAAAPRPYLPGEGHYFDAHMHTTAEWYQDDAFDVLAPRKAFGGPIPMIQESAFALGLTDAPGATADTVVTTDHNAFYRPGDDLRDRPQFGPTAPQNSNGKSEWERMGDLFGRTRGEEVTFTQLNRMIGPVPLPTGAHLLTYRAEHVDGPWHGGSGFARTLGSKDPDLPLADLLHQLSHGHRPTNRRAASYAAHPLSGSAGWADENILLGFELDPSTRTDLAVNAEGDGFVLKGLQVWNGDKKGRAVDPKTIDWLDLNPFVEPNFVAGDPDWDERVHRALGKLHELNALVLDYELAARPGVRFPRKVFGVAGNDAHGDFNYTETRSATILPLQSTFKVHRGAFGRVLTYALGDGHAGATSAERALEAMAVGSSVVTDGPLLRFTLDAEDRFDASALRWHDLDPRAEDADGRIGGGGVFDGQGTALVRRGSPNVRYGYTYLSTPEWGDVTAIEVYRTSANDPNPVGTKPSGAPRLTPRGHLAVGGAGLELEEPLDPAEEGLIHTPTVLSLGAFTHGDPDTAPVEGKRCFTNGVWAVPYDVEVVVGQTQTDASGNGYLPPGELTVRFRFDASLEPTTYAVELKALSSAGESSDQSLGAIDVLVPSQGSGWSDQPTHQSSVFEVTNQRDVPLNLDRYPAAGNDVSFVVYFYDAPRDAFGNALNRPATSFTVPGVGTGGGTGPALPRAGTTTPGATPAPAGGRGGSGGCALADEPDHGALLGLLGLLGLLALRRRR